VSSLADLLAGVLSTAVRDGFTYILRRFGDLPKPGLLILNPIYTPGTFFPQKLPNPEFLEEKLADFRGIYAPRLGANEAAP
jgi:hypothetical protein